LILSTDRLNCTYESRRLIKEIKKEKSLRLEDIELNPDLRDRLILEMCKRKSRKKTTSRSKTNKEVVDTEQSEVALCYSLNRQNTDRPHVHDFSLSKKRASNVMLSSPFPGDKRFQIYDVHENNFNLPFIKPDVKAHNKRVVQGTTFSQQLSRTNFYPDKSNIPDPNAYQTEDLVKSKGQSTQADRKMGAI